MFLAATMWSPDWVMLRSGVFDGGGAGSDGQTGGATFKGGDAVLEDALGGVGQTAGT